MSFINIQGHKNDMKMCQSMYSCKGENLIHRFQVAGHAAYELSVAVASIVEQLIRDLAYYLPGLVGACQKGEVKSFADVDTLLCRLGSRPDHTSEAMPRQGKWLFDSSNGPKYLYSEIIDNQVRYHEMTEDGVLTDWEASIDLASRSWEMLKGAVAG